MLDGMVAAYRIGDACWLLERSGPRRRAARGRRDRGRRHRVLPAPPEVRGGVDVEGVLSRELSLQAGASDAANGDVRSAPTCAWKATCASRATCRSVATARVGWGWTAPASCAGDGGCAPAGTCAGTPARRRQRVRRTRPAGRRGACVMPRACRRAATGPRTRCAPHRASPRRPDPRRHAPRGRLGHQGRRSDRRRGRDPRWREPGWRGEAIRAARRLRRVRAGPDAVGWRLWEASAGERTAPRRPDERLVGRPLRRAERRTRNEHPAPAPARPALPGHPALRTAQLRRSSALAFPPATATAAAGCPLRALRLGNAFSRSCACVAAVAGMELRIDVNQPDDSIEAVLGIPPRSAPPPLRRPVSPAPACRPCCPAWSSTTARPTAALRLCWRPLRTGAPLATCVQPPDRGRTAARLPTCAHALKYALPTRDRSISPARCILDARLLYCALGHARQSAGARALARPRPPPPALGRAAVRQAYARLCTSASCPPRTGARHLHDLPRLERRPTAALGLQRIQPPRQPTRRCGGVA